MKKNHPWILCACAALLAVAPVYGKDKAEADPAKPKAAKEKKVTVLIKTSMGDITLELDKEKAPATVENFLQYARDGHYKGTVFHRVISNFMIQGGGMAPDMSQKKTRNPVKNEAANGLKNLNGTVAMARTSQVDSATSQFFINHKDNAFLDYRGPSPREIGYAVFGKVIKGMKVVDAIAQTQTRPGDVPVETVVIKSITLVSAKDKTADKKETPPKQK